MRYRSCAVLLGILSLLVPAADVSAGQASVRTLYTRALTSERSLRDGARTPTLQQLRSAIDAYETIVRRYPTSGYSDNALWQAASLAILAYERFGRAVDKRTAVRVLEQLRTEYPSSSLVARVDEALKQADASQAPALARAATRLGPLAPPPHAPETSGTIAIRTILRTPLPNGIRVSIEMDDEASFHAERLAHPSRVFFDLKGARPVAALLDATLRFPDAIVREIRLGRHPQNTTRVVMDMEGAESYSVFTLYDPYRLIIDFKTADFKTADFKTAPAPLAMATGGGLPPLLLVPSRQPALAPPAVPAPKPVALSPAPPYGAPVKPVASRTVASLPAIPPALPAANSNGTFSLARQLGLGFSRIVIDAGHGGHDPGTQSHGINEAELVLDVALRLTKLIQKQTGIEVVMTRDTDTFVPLEERTAIANRQEADLFLSIHANASRDPKARGIETYFLNFASNPDAEAVAARENSASGRTLHSLPDIVRAIALNNKIDESRYFADLVQRSMVRRLSTRNKQLKDRGVKQAPFVVLIGAAMPSVLAEIAFLTHKQEGQLLKTGAYRQQIAESLLDAILRYQQSLKKMKTGASTVGAR